jgi:S-adenosylmethionine decarboxylase
MCYTTSRAPSATGFVGAGALFFWGGFLHLQAALVVADALTPQSGIEGGDPLHLTIDGYGGDAIKLADAELIRSVLDRYPGEIGMTKISIPHVMEYVGDKPEDWGVSGFVLIAESHISLHTFVEHRYVWVDIFSCKGFDATKVIEDLQRLFNLEQVKTRILERGLEYPHDVDASIPLMHQEREEVTAQAPEAGRSSETVQALS